jgi:RNA-directed DNA polymerase
MNQTEKLRYECEWSEVDWQSIERAVFKLQKRIYRASSSDNKKGVRHLQRLLLASKQAKLLAVRKVTQDNKGKNTPGVDGVASLKPVQRNELATNLKLNDKATPIRRVWIDKPGKSEKRPLGIPTISTRAEQTLLKMALEPEWEAKFEPDSYGFRPGRSCHDAIRAIYGAAFRKQAYVLDADIAGCFDNINH